MKDNKNYGLFTTISMIIGIVIGSGIIFKTGNVLKATNGNVFLGVLVFVFASLAIIFGSLTLSQLALRSNEHGGIISYTKESYGKSASGVLGWFISLVYFPTITAVLSWVSSVYLLMFLGISASLEFQILVAIGLLIFLSLLNIISAKASGFFQNFATIVKIIPLLLIALIGFFSKSNEVLTVQNNFTSDLNANVLMFLTAIGPISFIFDGWTVSTTISGEIKNPKKTLPIALAISPILILLIYILYFVGVTKVMDVNEIIGLGNDYIYVAFSRLLGDFGSKVLLFILVISMLGTTNGLVLGFSRTLNHLSHEDLIFLSEKIKSPLNKLPVKAIIYSGFITMFWLFIHYITMKFKLLNHSDVSEISIATLYLLLIFLYVKVMSLAKAGEIKGFFKGYAFPILAIIGSLIMFSGSLQNKYFLIYFGFSLLILLISYFYLKNKVKTEK